MSSAPPAGRMDQSPYGGRPGGEGGAFPTCDLRSWRHRTEACPIAADRDRSENAAMTSAAPTASRPAAAADWHRRQRDLVAASLVACPSSSRPTHRRWA